MPPASRGVRARSAPPTVRPTRPETVRARGSAGAETVNSPRTAAARARLGPRSTPGAAARRARPRVEPTGARRRSRRMRLREPLCRILRSALSALRHATRPARSSWSNALLDVQKVADQVVDVGAAETRHQVIPRLRDIDGVSAKAHVAEPWQVRARRNPIQQRVQIPEWSSAMRA